MSKRKKKTSAEDFSHRDRQILIQQCSIAFGNSAVCDRMEEYTIQDLRNVLKVLNELHSNQDIQAEFKYWSEQPGSQEKCANLTRKQFSTLYDAGKELAGTRHELDLRKNHGDPYDLLNEIGDNLRVSLRAIIRLIDELRRGGQTHLIRIAASNSIITKLLPGAVAAFKVWVHGQNCPDELDAVVSNCSYKEVEVGLKQGRYDLGISWYSDWRDARASGAKRHTFSSPLIEDCQFLAVTPCNDLTSATDRKDLQAFPTKHKRGIELSDLEAAIKDNKWRLAALRSDSSRDLKKLVAAAEPSKIVWVERYEDSLSQVRASLADVACVPEWFAKAPHVEKCKLLGGSKPFSRRIHLESVNDLSQADDWLGRFSRLLQKFFVDHKDQLLTRGGELMPKAVVQWARAYKE